MSPNIIRMIRCLLILPSLMLPGLSQADPVRYEVDGLSKPAEIIVDEYGVPHIYANTHYDTFFVQGFNAARDRLWQIDLWRRRGLGELSEVLGPAFLEQDKAARLFLYRGSMFREWLAYGSDAKKISESFTAGINAFIKLIDTHPGLLPVEFSILDYTPALWKPEDVVRIRSNGLWRNLTDEIRRARVVCEAGLDVDAYRRKLEPEWRTTVPAGLDPCDVTEDVGRLYSLAKAPVDFKKSVQFADGTVPAKDYSYSLALLEDQLIDAGSNNWAVSPARTDTGRPILANDPHRGHAVPSLRYIAHLNGPGINVIGAGEPALPGISIGHNEKIAFGLTIFSIDQEDLMVYEVKDGKYRYKDQWKAFETIAETFNVRDGKPVTYSLDFTVHGPVLARNEAGTRAFAAQAAWLQPGMAPYFGSVEYMRASNWREFLAALNRWGAPSENQVYADTEGNIGYKPAGLTPVRPHHDGLLPVPGDGRYDWQGFYDMDQLPVEFNPARGFVATANAMSLPEDFPYRSIKTGFEWAAPWRIRRITEVLASQNKHSLADSVALQRDYLSIPARTVLGSLDVSKLPEPAARLFSDWDFVLAPDSAAATVFEVWISHHLVPAVMADLTANTSPELLGNMTNFVTVEQFIRYAESKRQELAKVTLERALAEVRQRLGEDVAGWRWGDLHQMKFRHPLYDVVDEETRKLLAMPVVARGGSADTPNSTRYNQAFDVVSGASWRMVLDVGNWDVAYMTNAPGQSGVPGSQHYLDMVSMWGDDASLPLLYSREAVELHKTTVIQLLPVTEAAP
ncbi:MAG: penicillin acylase family protein [Pseudomonadales bacterium]|nr:penicillin acylase family protein [Pseudomonadales bacterium]